MTNYSKLALIVLQRSHPFFRSGWLYLRVHKCFAFIGIRIFLQLRRGNKNHKRTEWKKYSDFTFTFPIDAVVVVVVDVELCAARAALWCCCACKCCDCIFALAIVYLERNQIQFSDIHQIIFISLFLHIVCVTIFFINEHNSFQHLIQCNLNLSSTFTTVFDSNTFSNNFITRFVINLFGLNRSVECVLFQFDNYILKKTHTQFGFSWLKFHLKVKSVQHNIIVDNHFAHIHILQFLYHFLTWLSLILILHIRELTVSFM